MNERNELAGAYDALYRKQGFGDAPAFYDWLVGLAMPSAGSRVLDIGCGAGGALRAIEAAGARGVGVDLSSVALEHAQKVAPTAQLLRSDGSRLPFADDSFDVVLNLGNLEHFDDWRAGVREMARVARPGGRAWVLLPNLFYSGTIWQTIRFGTGPDHHQPIDRFATRAEWHAVLESGGLRVLRSIPYHKGKWWKRLLPANLAWHFLYETEPGDAAPAPALPPLERRWIDRFDFR
ncbi:MAG: class I SAM-dependent methyltransferase [Planctomycetota bacterium]